MSKLFVLCILLLIWSVINLIYSLILVHSSTEEKQNISFDFPDDMSRTQKRLFEKQMNQFKCTFNNFSNYQLSAIKQLIESILKGRC